eukprot:TRINITY_DN11576_c0_g1_i1.p1 TRINITY_DN11576_c0_g1~~TRINITY_DN11576_c0_g1_i1.p1  ORF type:complete len:188 (+),score=44.95 TRINITY_DN11576_c0_g1_i1:60-623(+)
MSAKKPTAWGASLLTSSKPKDTKITVASPSAKISKDLRVDQSKETKKTLISAEKTENREKSSKGNELDDIFSAAKRKSRDDEATISNVHNQHTSKKKKKKGVREEVIVAKDASKDSSNSNTAASDSKPKLAPGRAFQKQDDDYADVRGESAKGRKIVDGLKVYTEDELKIGRGGDTDLCPFDCDCCF